MRKLTATLSLTLTILLGSVGVSVSADFKNCKKEYVNKNYDAAVRLCRPFAERGKFLLNTKWVLCTATEKVFNRTIRLL